MLDNTNNVLVGRSSDVSLDSLEQVLSSNASSLGVGGSNVSQDGVLASSVQSSDVVSPDTGVELNNGDLLVVSLGQQVNVTGTDVPKYPT